MNTMDEKLKVLITRRGRGQGLPEYALILVLVAIASIIALVLIGTAVQRIYGLATGGLGANTSKTQGDTVITIDTAECYAVKNYVGRPGGRGDGPATGIRVTGQYGPLSRIGPSMVIVSTNNMYSTDAAGDAVYTKDDESDGTYLWSFFISFDKADVGLCPGAATAQVEDGSNSIATSPVAYYQVDSN